MSIDYDRLRELLAETEKTPTAPYLWIDLARELLRLRDELTDLRDTMYSHAELICVKNRLVAADYVHNHADRLTRIIRGDNP